ncbi:MAG: hypothetical protein ACHP7P_06900 [Terriglobales bacterium]
MLYIILAVIFVASLVLVWVSPGGWVGQLAGVPAVAALFGALFKVFMDHLAHQRAVFLLEAQNAFSMGATSHMANVAFEKHVGFCEEYVQEMFKALSTLFREGPTEDVLRHATALYKVREKWALWLTANIETELDRFENAIQKIGAHAHLLDASLNANERHERIAEMYALFAEVVGLGKWEDAPISEERAVKTVIVKLRKVLGIEELTDLRTELVRRSRGATTPSRKRAGL